MVYPQIVSSVPFQLELMNTPFRFPGQHDSMSIYTYYTDVKETGILEGLKKYTIGLPGVIKKAIKKENETATIVTKNNNYFSLTEEQDEVREMLSEKINLDVNDKDGFPHFICQYP